MKISIVSFALILSLTSAASLTSAEFNQARGLHRSRGLKGGSGHGGFGQGGGRGKKKGNSEGKGKDKKKGKVRGKGRQAILRAKVQEECETLVCPTDTTSINCDIERPDREEVDWRDEYVDALSLCECCTDALLRDILPGRIKGQGIGYAGTV